MDESNEKQGVTGFIFSRASIYLLRIYSDLLAVSVFEPTHTHTLTPTPALTLTLTLSLRPHHQKELCGIYFNMYEDLLKDPNKSQKNKSW